VPDDVKAVAEAVIAHRLILAPEARAAGLSGGDLVRDAVEKTRPGLGGSAMSLVARDTGYSVRPP
jgi:hypothetical protein